MIYKLFSSWSTWKSWSSVPNTIKIGLLYTTIRTRNNFTGRKFDVILYSALVKWMAFIIEFARKCGIKKTLFIKFTLSASCKKNRHSSISMVCTWVQLTEHRIPRKHTFGTTAQKFCVRGCFLKSLLCCTPSTVQFNLKYRAFPESVLLPSSGQWLLL